MGDILAADDSEDGVVDDGEVGGKRKMVHIPDVVFKLLLPT